MNLGSLIKLLCFLFYMNVMFSFIDPDEIFQFKILFITNLYEMKRESQSLVSLMCWDSNGCYKC